MSRPNFASRTMWTGDNLDILRGLNSETVDLIYLDPPFNSNQDFAAPVGSKAAGAAFKDTWTLSDLDVAWMGLIAEEQPAVAALLATTGEVHGKGMQSYLTMMAVRLIEMHRVLKDTGSIYIHCDQVASHYLKALMDAIFGRTNFRNEIIWHYRTSSGRPRYHFIKNTDTLLFYSKAPRRNTFNMQKEPWPASTLKKWQSDAQGIYRTNNGRKYYIDPDGKLIDNVWAITLSSRSRERVGYRRRSRSRCSNASSKHRATRAIWCWIPSAAAPRPAWQRTSWTGSGIGIDISPKAADLVYERLQDLYDRPFFRYELSIRTDIPQRTDVDAPKNYRQNKHVLYGQQEGRCGGCETHFEFRNFEVDHVVPQSRGGTGHIENLQLLCGHCNRVKGNRPQEYLLAQLAEMAGVRG